MHWLLDLLRRQTEHVRNLRPVDYAVRLATYSRRTSYHRNVLCFRVPKVRSIDLGLSFPRVLVS